MYYITNQNNQVVAADKALLELLGLQNVEALYQKMIKGELSFTSLSPESLTISSDESEAEHHTFNLNSSSLSSMLGELTLNVLTTSEPSEKEDDETISFTEPEKINLTAHEEEPVTAPETEEASKDEDIISILDEDFLKEPEEETSIAEEEPEPVDESSDFEPISIIEEEEVELPTDEAPITEEAEAPVTETVEEAEKTTAPIYIDIAQVSETIGITPDEYNNFLNEFIDTAISLEKDLNSDNDETQSSAVKTLVHLSELLQLPQLSDAAKAIDEASAQERDTQVESFYNILARVTTQPTTLSEAEEEMLVAPEMELEEKEEEGALPEGSFGTIDLSDVKPIHFDFRLEEAAEELSLPVELIDEFVHDFIDQARTETENMLEAYKQGDLNKIQKIGHLLKGASSNLRINPLADTLYEIQFCEDSSKLEALIKSYWAHFIAFEKQMELTSK
ncbi:MAG: Hpt domain-containing protein [Sulfurimonas sp.]